MNIGVSKRKDSEKGRAFLAYLDTVEVGRIDPGLIKNHWIARPPNYLFDKKNNLYKNYIV
jgi:hypothetical protein